MSLQPGLYRHYKGGRYRLVALARHSETLEELVIYQNADDPSLWWARPAAMWDEEVLVDGKPVRRFTRIED